MKDIERQKELLRMVVFGKTEMNEDGNRITRSITMKTDEEIKAIAKAKYPYPEGVFTKDEFKELKEYCDYRRESFFKGYKQAQDDKWVSDEEIEEMAFEMFPMQETKRLFADPTFSENIEAGISQSAATKAMKSLRDKRR